MEEFDSIEDWRSRATLPPDIPAHPKFPKSVVENIAVQSEIDGPADIHALWLRLSQAALSYDRLKGVSFNERPKATRKHAKALLSRLAKARSLLDPVRYEDELWSLEGHENTLQMQALDYDPYEADAVAAHLGLSTPYGRPLVPENTIQQFRGQLDAMTASLEAIEKLIESPRRGRTENHALNLFVHQIMALWMGHLKREITVDHNNDDPKVTKAEVFACDCAHELDVVPSKAVNSALRRFLADNNRQKTN